MALALEEVAVVATKPPISQLHQLPELGAALLSAAMALPCVMGVAHAETAPEKGTLSFKYLDYKERQQQTDETGNKNAGTYSKSGASAFDDRIRVKATASSVAPTKVDGVLTPSAQDSDTDHSTVLGRLSTGVVNLKGQKLGQFINVAV